MPAPAQISEETKTRRKAMAFWGSLTAVLGMWVFGFPLTPATITAMLLGTIQIAAAVLQFLSRRFQTTQSEVIAGQRSCTPRTALLRRRGIAMGSWRSPSELQ